MTRDHAVRAQITSGPSESAGLILDVNDCDPMYVLHDGFTLGTAGGGTRQVGLNVRLRGVDASVPQAISALMRAINQRRTYLLWQAHSTHELTWFRILDTVTEMDFAQTTVDDPVNDTRWTVSVSLTVEEFSYGERVTLPAVTVSNAELGYAIADEILGDAPTAAMVMVKPGESQVWHNWEQLLCCVPVEASCPLGAPGAPGEVVTDPVPAVISWEAEAFTLGGDATVVANANSSGGSTVGIPADNTAWRTVLSGTVPVKPPPGRYSVYARLVRTASSGKVRLRFGLTGFTVSLTNDAPLYAPSNGAGDASWMHLADVSLPGGQPFDGLTDADITAPGITLRAQGLASGPVDGKVLVDRFVLVPVELAQGGEARTVRAKWGASGPFGPGPLWNSWKVDGQNRRNGLVAYDGTWYTSTQPPRTLGGLPVLHPGQRNVLMLLHKVHNATGGGVGTELVTATADVTVSYSPRYRHLAGS